MQDHVYVLSGNFTFKVKAKPLFILLHQRGVKAEHLEDFSSKVALVRNVNSPKKLHKFSLTPAVTMATTSLNY